MCIRREIPIFKTRIHNADGIIYQNIFLAAVTFLGTLSDDIFFVCFGNHSIDISNVWTERYLKKISPTEAFETQHNMQKGSSSKNVFWI